MRPPVIAPMLAGGRDPPRDLSGWLVEPKWDGVRVVVTTHEGTTRLASRKGNDVTAGYPELAGLAADVGRSAVFDGEVVAFDQGRPSFQTLQRRMHVRSPAPELVEQVPVELMLFDLLWLDGAPFTDRPQWERRAALEGLGIEGPCWHTSPVLPPAPVDELMAACEAVGMEGYMLKRAEATYLPGRRTSSWVKLKCVKRRELVVGGWIPGSGHRSGSIGSLAGGVYGLDRDTGESDGRLHFVGAAGSGLTEDLIRQLAALFERTAADTSPFVETLVGVHFVEPLLVAEVNYTLINEGGILRHPTLHGFRTDVDASEVVADEELQPLLDRRPPKLRIRL